MSIVVLVGLFLCNAIWATNPVMGKILLEQYPPLQASWIRYGSAFFGIWLAAALLRFLKPKFWQNPRAIPLSLWKWLVAIGLITFLGSPIAQMTGLHGSTSTANSLIVALEPLFAVILAWLLLSEKLKWNQFLAFGIALLGFLLLSHFKPNDIKTIFVFSGANFLLLLAMPMEAAYTVISRRLKDSVAPIPLFAFSLSIGFVVFTAVLLLTKDGLPTDWPQSGKVWLALLWMGPLGTSLTYVAWSFALLSAPVAAVALTLFIQPILGAIFGMVFLGDRLDLWQSVGAALILFALTLQTLSEWRSQK
jgi:drug/metabolite transporter (DMT)-like permease